MSLLRTISSLLLCLLIFWSSSDLINSLFTIHSVAHWKKYLWYLMCLLCCILQFSSFAYLKNCCFTILLFQKKFKMQFQILIIVLVTFLQVCWFLYWMSKVETEDVQVFFATFKYYILSGSHVPLIIPVCLIPFVCHILGAELPWYLTLVQEIVQICQ